jgi:hypothetical protein
MEKLSTFCADVKLKAKKLKNKVVNGAIDVINCGINAYNKCPNPLIAGVGSGIVSTIAWYVASKDPVQAIYFGIKLGLLGAVIDLAAEFAQSNKKWTGRYI